MQFNKLGTAMSIQYIHTLSKREFPLGLKTGRTEIQSNRSELPFSHPNTRKRPHAMPCHAMPCYATPTLHM